MRPDLGLGELADHLAEVVVLGRQGVGHGVSLLKDFTLT
jgi:hypothetical protein